MLFKIAQNCTKILDCYILALGTKQIIEKMYSNRLCKCQIKGNLCLKFVVKNAIIFFNLITIAKAFEKLKKKFV